MISPHQIKDLARACGFELAGIAPALPVDDFERFQNWRAAGMAGEMRYLTDRRGDLRSDPRNLLSSAKSIVCVGKLYNTGFPHWLDIDDHETGWISRYAWGSDYHDVMRAGLEDLLKRIVDVVCVDSKKVFFVTHRLQIHFDIGNVGAFVALAGV